MTAAVRVFPDTYVDSVVQLRAMRAMREVDGVDWASAAMATPANVDTLRERGRRPRAGRRRRVERLRRRRPGGRPLTQRRQALAAGEQTAFPAAGRRRAAGRHRAEVAARGGPEPSRDATWRSSRCPATTRRWPPTRR